MLISCNRGVALQNSAEEASAVSGRGISMGAPRWDALPAKRIAILFWRYGPYHQARLAGASGNGWRVLGIEACKTDRVYEWDRVQSKGGFERRTLVERCETSAERRELHRAMGMALSEYKPDVVLVPGWSFPDALSSLQWCLANGTPAVIMSESTAWDEERKAWKEGIKRRLVGLFAAALVGATPQADYLAALGMPRERIFMGYDAVDNEYFARSADEVRSRGAEFRGQQGLPERYFLASARFVEKKNLARLIQAYARYRQAAAKLEGGAQAPEVWGLVILGDGPLKATIEQQVANLHLQAYVHLPGFRQYDELPAYYGSASGFIHASTKEQWGLVVNEAMASGLPVLVSNRCGCAADLVQEGVNGFTFDPHKVEQIADLMLRISAVEFPLSGFGEASRRIISSWGTARFAEGAQQAAAAALSGPCPKATWLEVLLLKLLQMRRAAE